jgi:hypothetical protein
MKMNHRQLQMRRLRARYGFSSRNLVQPLNEVPNTWLAMAIASSILGLSLLTTAILAIIFVSGWLGGALLVLATPFSLIGVLLLLIEACDRLSRCLHRTHHCGSCRYYQPEADAYERGLCLVDPREPVVQRTYWCPYYTFSERAMVRDRLSQHSEKLRQCE